jgi:dTDP-4-amino-4,6-dideoxygalactose transaminase
MLVTDNKLIADHARLLREHGMTRSALDREKAASWYYDVIDIGYNYRLSEAQAALGISQLKRVTEINQNRINAANYYTERLEKTRGIIAPYQASERNHVFHLYVVKVVEKKFGLDREKLFSLLTKNGIGLSVHYTPLHLMTFYKNNFKYKLGDFPVAERLYKEILSLPIFPTITKTQQNYVTKHIMGSRRKVESV